MSTTRTPRAASVRNETLASAMRDKRRSGAAGTHADRRFRRTRTRAASRARSLKDW